MGQLWEYLWNVPFNRANFSIEQISKWAHSKVDFKKCTISQKSRKGWWVSIIYLEFSCMCFGDIYFTAPCNGSVFSFHINLWASTTRLQWHNTLFTLGGSVSFLNLCYASQDRDTLDGFFRIFCTVWQHEESLEPPTRQCITCIYRYCQWIPVLFHQWVSKCHWAHLLTESAKTLNAPQIDNFL